MNWLLRLFHKSRSEAQLDNELRFHLDQQVAAYMAAGISPEEARRRARLEFGGLEGTKEECREARRTNFVENALQDLRYGLRMLLKHLGFTTVAILTLALGIGANTVVFSVVNSILLKPMPYPEANRLAFVWSTEVSQGASVLPTAPPDFREWRARNGVFEGLGACTYINLNLIGASPEPERLQGARITAGLFSVLGVSPAKGRLFLSEEEQFGRHSVALISYGLWERRFGLDEHILGRNVNLSNEPFTIVGVMPKGMPFFDDVPSVDLWVPLAFAPGDNFNTRNNRFLYVAGRLRKGVSLEQANAQMAAIAKRIESEDKENLGYGVTVKSMQSQLTESIRPALLLLVGAVGFVLLVACVNVASLLLGRTKDRERELAVRTALGATRGRLIRQLVVESLVLSLAGGAVGAVLVAFSMNGLLALLPESIPRFNPVGWDGNVFVFTAGISMLTALLFGVLPALRASKTDVHDALKEGGRSGIGHRGYARSVLVVSEVAIALCLLIGAGLLVKSFALLRQVDRGFSEKNLLTMQIPLSDANYPQPDFRNPYPQAAIGFLDRLLSRVRALPGVRTAGITTALPLGIGGGWGKYIWVVEHPKPPSLKEMASSSFVLVSPAYFESIGARLRQGRFFTNQDTRNSQSVTIINEALARKFFPDEDPLGKSIIMEPPKEFLPKQSPEPPDAPRRTIVGVVTDIKNAGLDQPAQPEVYAPLTQCEFEGWSNTVSFAVKTDGDPLRMAPAIRTIVADLDPTLPVANVSSMDQLVGNSLSNARFSLILLTFFAASALLLTALGIYGVIADSIRQRTREIGVRVALGARPSEIFRLVVGGGMKLAALGLAIGLALSFVLTQALTSLLYGVKPSDPATYLFVTVILAGVSLLACYLPARRSTRVDPMVALRYE